MSFSFAPYKDKFQKTVEYVQDDLRSLRTGKATPQLLDTVRVEAYGAQMSLNEVSQVTAPDPTLLVVTPWDKNILESVEKAIASAQLNLNPVVDGDIIRIAVPPLTEERRMEMVKILHQKVEAGKKMLRNVRIDAKKDIEKLKGSDGVSEDDIAADLDELETIFKSYLEQLDEIVTKKEQELTTI